MQLLPRRVHRIAPTSPERSVLSRIHTLPVGEQWNFPRLLLVFSIWKVTGSLIVLSSRTSWYDRRFAASVLRSPRMTTGQAWTAEASFIFLHGRDFRPHIEARRHHPTKCVTVSRV